MRMRHCSPSSCLAMVEALQSSSASCWRCFIIAVESILSFHMLRCKAQGADGSVNHDFDSGLNPVSLSCVSYHVQSAAWMSRLLRVLATLSAHVVALQGTRVSRHLAQPASHCYYNCNSKDYTIIHWPAGNTSEFTNPATVSCCQDFLSNLSF